jgi:hypothetical protein
VVLRTVSPKNPLITVVSSPSRTSTAVRVSGELRKKEWSWSSIRDQPYCSAAQRPPVTQSNSEVKWSASRIRKVSGEVMPSLANAKIVFF